MKKVAVVTDSNAGIRQKEAKELGFSNAAIMDTQKLVFKPEYRKFCEENQCGCYNVNPACPPECGTDSSHSKRSLRYFSGRASADPFPGSSPCNTSQIGCLPSALWLPAGSGSYPSHLPDTRWSSGPAYTTFPASGRRSP